MARFGDLPLAGRIYVPTVAGLGLAATIAAVAWQPPQIAARPLLFIGLAVVGGMIRVPLPVLGSLSLAYTFVFATLMGFGVGASCLAGVLSALASAIQARLRAEKASAHTAWFNVGLVGLCTALAGSAYVGLGGRIGAKLLLQDLLPIAAYTLIFSFVNIGLISLAIQFSGHERATTSLPANFRWAVPGYVAGSSLAALLGLLLVNDSYELLILAGPFAYLMHLSYRARTEQMDDERRHSKQTAELYTAVTEALAVAVEAKDEGTEEHLRRVREYCLGIAEILDLPVEEMEALRAASLLHDIGKIAVPEYVLNKPGRLTPEEMDMMKIHPGVGADILERVPFPYPLAPIVRHHHERWDGEGYPAGLSGEAIPLGARILTAVDCFDALTTDRPYRKAIPRAEALEFLQRESGRIFDPRVVEILVTHVDPLERRLQSTAQLSDGVEITLATPRDTPAIETTVEDFSAIVARLEQELDLTERLRLLAQELEPLLPFRSLVVYRFDEARENIVACFASGHAADRLTHVTMPVGERISGWVALHQRPYRGHAHVNPLERDGSRSDLEDQLHDPEIAELRSALAAPLSTEDALIGVLALYHGPTFHYDDAHLAQLSQIASQLAAPISGRLPTAANAEAPSQLLRDL